MAEFLAENNACGQNLLRIVSMGDSIIAEILRLKDYIPEIYRLDSKADQQKYSEIILDFSYLQITEAQDQKIETCPELQDLDLEVCESYTDLLTRFYLAFESTHQYAADLQQYINELNRGYYIQQSVESVLQDEEGKQLLCEALYLFGAILLILDLHIPGIIRERLLISYYRYSGVRATDNSSFEDVCMLLRSTGYVAEVLPNAGTLNKKIDTSNIVPNYPEAYFSRFNFDKNFVDLVIARLRCDDIYNQLAIYPHPEHRSTALSTQAAMLYVCLYFSPKILHEQTAQMREIIDKFFADNWVVSIYMGITVNLIDAWQSFKAANAALTPVVDTISVKGFCVLERDQMVRVLEKTQELLRDGVLNDFYVLEHIKDIIVLMRKTNVVLRWYFLHNSQAIFVVSPAHQKAQQVQQLVRTDLQYTDKELLRLLLNCSELELIVKDIIRDLMQQRDQRWSSYKKESMERLKELSEAFAGSRPLSKIDANPQLQQWFAELADDVDKQNIANPNKSGRFLIQLIQALEEVQEFHNLHANMLVKQYLQETREYLTRMMQIINIKEDIEINIQMISDFSYAWRLMDRDLVSVMQESIKKHATTVIRIRATFLKLASALEKPLMRINQANSEDYESVSEYYSTELANYMRKVLQIIPQTMFNILAQIIQLQTDVIKELPTRLPADKLYEYAQYDDRFTMARLTQSIAVFTKGILMMKKTLVGVIVLDPKQLLEDGIRKELVNHLSNAFNVGLIFTPAKGKQPAVELVAKLTALAKTVDGYRRSFEYVEDYLNVQGLRILNEEIKRIINYNTERECNAYLRNKVQEWQSEYQSQTIPIPSFSPVQGDVRKSKNFIGRLAHEILQVTDPRQTIFLDMKVSWYDKKTPHTPIIERTFFATLREAIMPAGMVGLEKLYAHMLVDELKRHLDKLQKNLSNDKMWCEALTALTAQLEAPDFPKEHAKQPLKFYTSYITRWQKVWPTLLEWVLNMGHKQILRTEIASELGRSSRCEAKTLQSSLETVNRALLIDITHKMDSEEGSKVITSLNNYFLYMGMHTPLEQVFTVTKNTHNMSLFLFLFTIAHLPRFQYSIMTNLLQAKSPKDNIDFLPFIYGLLTIFQQFHDNVRCLFISYLCQFVNVNVEANLSDTPEPICNEVVIVIHFLKIFIRMSKWSQDVLTARMPKIILDKFEFMATPIKK